MLKFSYLDLFSDKVSQKFVANLQAKHIRQPDRNRDTESHCVGFRFLTRSSFEQNAVDAFAFLDDSSAIDSRKSLPESPLCQV